MGHGEWGWRDVVGIALFEIALELKLHNISEMHDYRIIGSRLEFGYCFETIAVNNILIRQRVQFIYE